MKKIFKTTLSNFFLLLISMGYIFLGISVIEDTFITKEWNDISKMFFCLCLFLGLVICFIWSQEW